MTDGQVCCGCIVVHPDGDDELNVAATIWRCWKRAYSRVRVTLTVTVRVSRVSVMVSVRDSVK